MFWLASLEMFDWIFGHRWHERQRFIVLNQQALVTLGYYESFYTSDVDSWLRIKM